MIKIILTVQIVCDLFQFIRTMLAVRMFNYLETRSTDNPSLIFFFCLDCVLAYGEALLTFACI